MYCREYKLKTTVIWSLIILLLTAGSVSAVAPHPVEYQKAVKSGKIAPITPKQIADDLSRGINQPSVISKLSDAQLSGTYRALAVLIEFSDNAAVTNGEYFDTLLFEDRMNTVRDYYQEVSNGTLDIVALDLPSALGWVSAPETYAYYVDGQRGTGSYPNNTRRLCEDVVDLIDPVVDFSNYDNDGDGFVDALILIHAGPGYETSFDVNDIHSHKWATSYYMNKDGVTVFEYCIQPEYQYASGDMTCGVFCHELGHIFGLPDLYDTDYSSNGIGLWSLMASGSWGGPAYDGSYPAHLDAWSRIELGFATASNVTSNATNVSIDAVENGGTIYRLWSSGSTGNEYFLVENRQAYGYDVFLPGDGLLIWHIDDNVSGWTPNDDEWYPGHTVYGHFGVALEQADGLWQLEQDATNGDSGDPFPGNSNNTSFSGLSTPNSNAYDGSGTYVSVSNISASGATMTADFQVSFAADVDDEDVSILPSELSLGQNYPNPFNPSTLISFELPSQSFVTFSIYNALGQKVKTILEDHISAGRHTVSWDGKTEEGLPAGSGIYLYEIVTDYGKETNKMTLIK